MYECKLEEIEKLEERLKELKEEINCQDNDKCNFYKDMHWDDIRRIIVDETEYAEFSDGLIIFQYKQSVIDFLQRDEIKNKINLRVFAEDKVLVGPRYQRKILK